MPATRAGARQNGQLAHPAPGIESRTGYCQCESCRGGSAGPVNAFTLWNPAAVKVTKGADHIGSDNKTPNSDRKWCKTCSGHLLTAHPGMGLTDVYAATIPDFPYQPGVDVHDQATRLPMRDGLPKRKDMPAETGGSGITIAD